MRERAVRRMVGLLQARLPELDLEEVPDPRARKGRWSLTQLLGATLVGLVAGCRSPAEAEQLTATLAPTMHRRLGLPRRLADTTARDALCRVPLEGLREALHLVVRAAWRRKALEPVALPFGVVALDGKATAPLDTTFAEDDRRGSRPTRMACSPCWLRRIAYTPRPKPAARHRGDLRRAAGAIGAGPPRLPLASTFSRTSRSAPGRRRLTSGSPWPTMPAST